MSALKAGDRCLICIDGQALLARVVFAMAADGLVRVRCKGYVMSLPAECLRLDSVSG